MQSSRLRPALTLLLPLLLAAVSHAAEESTQGLRYPSLTPDGKSVVFCYRGDIWISPRDGKGPAQRLTIHEEQDTLCRVSPDGQQIAYWSAARQQLKRIGISGGAPVVIGSDPIQNIRGASWGFDNMIVFASNDGIVRVPANGGTSEVLFAPADGEVFQAPSMLPDGDHFDCCVLRRSLETCDRCPERSACVVCAKTLHIPGK